MTLFYHFFLLLYTVRCFLNRPIVSNDEEGHSLRSALTATTITVALFQIVMTVLPFVAANIQLVVNRARAKQALSAVGHKQRDYLENVPYRGADAALMEGFIGKYVWLYNQVKDFAPMDYKRDNRRPWWGLGKEQFYFRGRMITFEENGNINYGYVGKALGIPDWIIYAGGGYAAVHGYGDTSGGISYFFDSQEDHDNISWGISLYNETWGAD